MENKYSEDRKYCLIDSNTSIWLEKVKKENSYGLCFKKFKVDFVIENIKNLQVGEKIVVNGIEMEITKIGKNCFANDCELFKKTGKSCLLKDNVLFAK